MEYDAILIAALALALGGILKGAIGAGAPIMAVPIMAIFYSVPIAVVVFTIPNLVSNGWQLWAYRRELLAPRFVWSLVIGGGLGAVVGSFILAFVSGEFLMAGLGAIVFGYIGLRLAKPDWKLSQEAADRVVLPVGVAAGLMQGAGGISAPVSLTFLNAMRLERGAFIATISAFFTAMGVAQAVTLVALGIMTPMLTLWSTLAVIPLFGAMPLGAWLGRRIPREAFDRVILGLLVIVALKLFYDALT